MQGVPRALPDCSNRASLADVSQFRTKKNNALSRGRRAHHYEHWPVISGHSEIGPDSRAVRPITPVKSRSIPARHGSFALMQTAFGGRNPRSLQGKGRSAYFAESAGFRWSLPCSPRR